jgi:hypothetical protein
VCLRLTGVGTRNIAPIEEPASAANMTDPGFVFNCTSGLLLATSRSRVSEHVMPAGMAGSATLSNAS